MLCCVVAAWRIVCMHKQCVRIYFKYSVYVIYVDAFSNILEGSD